MPTASSEKPHFLPHFFELTPEALTDHTKQWGQPAFRAKQLMDWVYRKGIGDLDLMPNLGAPARQAFAQNLILRRGQISEHEKASDGTQKLLLAWTTTTTAPGSSNPVTRGNNSDTPEESHGTERSGSGVPNGDSTASTTTSLPVLSQQAASHRCGVSSASNSASTTTTTTTTTTDLTPDEQTECVLIPSHPDRTEGKTRRTACVSSQIGCPVGCKFCASGVGGLDGNLTAGQIIEQIWTLGQLPSAHPNLEPGRVTNVVFMGMGEPLSNYKAVVKAIELMTAQWGLNLSARKITVSTVGLPAQIKRLADLEKPVTLAISMHAPNDTIRRQLIPWAEYVSIDQLVDAGQYFFNQTGREVTIEYTLMQGTNDSLENADELAALVKKLRSNLNLIRYNETPGMPFKRPDDATVHRFRDRIAQHNINVHIRASRGRDISAACGQLRYEAQKAKAQIT